ncbi:hypothetical protein EB077_10580, partial [bacterium]|nr:hypothetical protein [bacterium]
GLTGTLSIVAGSNVTVSTAVGNVILAAAQGPQGPAGSFGDPQTIQPKTTSYTLRLTDVGTLLTFAGGTSAITVTVPDQSSVAWAAGSHIDVARLDSSPVTFYGSGNSYIYATPSPSLRDLGSGASLVYLGSDKWLLVGDLA